MRIISGCYKGKKLLGYDIEGTRPTQDRVKESLFAMLQDDLREAVVLDLFAGSGNLGMEAISNGASKVYFVDHNRKCIEVLMQNLKMVPKDCYQVFQMDYQEALINFSSSSIQFDIILLDPPYQLQCLDQILEMISHKNLLREDGMIVCEYEVAQFQDCYQGFLLEKSRKYGYKNIRIYRKEKVWRYIW